jgi:hypothetical protein
MQRAQRKTFAAIDDPYRISERLERERDAHRSMLAGRPPDLSQELAKAAAAVAAIEREVQDVHQNSPGLEPRIGL